ncbi:PadR family transcriptional regulator [Erysipelotrichaceae bacterium]|nr:PadR family transcriptional regulator [Erysipelotrichaceae bacterium]
MISSDAIRGYTDIMLLFLLLEKASYGYELSKEIRALTLEQYNIKETTLYSAFTRLEKNGYITSFPGTETQGKKRIYYKITPTGKEHYEKKCEEWKLIKKVVGKFIAKK